MFQTDRLIIRPAKLEDAPLLFDLNSDPEVVRYTGDGSFKTMMEAQEIIRDRMIAQFEKYKMSRFMVFLKDGTYLGWCGLKYFPETNEVDLGYRFYKKSWGKGYATESSKEMLRYGFETLNLKRIIAKAMPANVNSIKVMQKLGMTFRGYVHDPTDPHPFVLFDMTQEEYRK
jgi:[ribosomal protein S5]-alanine N-acetyltransferase